MVIRAQTQHISGHARAIVRVPPAEAAADHAVLFVGGAVVDADESEVAQGRLANVYR